MFDFGNKKLIEDLKREVKFQNNLVGVGLAIQDDLKKKNEILEKEKIEYQKTIEFLTGEIDKLKDEIKKMKKNILDSCEYEGNVEEKHIEVTDNKSGKSLDAFNNIIGLNYKEIKNDIEKITLNNKFTFFKFKNKDFILLNDDYIKNIIKKKIVPTYCGIPFRKLQDFYQIIDFLESDNYIGYFKERKEYDYSGCLEPVKIKNNIKFCYKNFILDNNNINNIMNKHYIFEDGINYYIQRNICKYNGKYFTTENELRQIIKEECYYNKKMLNYILKILYN